jgi:hypothetical protein
MIRSGRSVGPAYEKLLQGGFLSSAQTVEDIVRVTPNCLVMIDEFGAWFKMIQDQSGNVQQLPMTLCKLWGQKYSGKYPVIRRANRDAKEDDKTFIQWPTFALAGATISEPFWTACGDEHISGGFLNRCYILDAGLGAMEFVTPTCDADELPEWMTKLIRIGAKGHDPMQGATPIMTGYLAPWRLSWEPGADEAYNDRRSELRRLPEGRKGSLSIRAHEMAMRLASVVCLWSGKLQMSAADFEWAWALAEHSRDMVLMRTKTSKSSATSKRSAITSSASSQTAQRDGWTFARSAGGQYGMDIVDKAIAELKECGEVREIPHNEQVARKLRGERGAPGRMFELAGGG